MDIAVLLSEVNSKGLARSFELALASLEKLLVILLRQTRKVLRIQKAKRPCCPGRFIRELRAKINLNAFNGIEHNEPELSIEDVELPHLLEGRPLDKPLVLLAILIGNRLAFEVVPVSAQSVIPNISEMSDEAVTVSDEPSLINQQVSLLLKGEPRL